jgi:hypothetical protein
MYLARFSYDVLPANRQRAIEFIRREIEAARREDRNARLLVPLTRGQGGAALQFEVELGSLDQLERIRHGDGSGEDIGREDLVGTCAARHDATTVVAWAEIAPARIARTGHC